MSQTVPSVRLLDSGYWHVRWSDHRWMQWPRGREPTMRDGFGWITQGDIEQALRLVACKTSESKATREGGG